MAAATQTFNEIKLAISKRQTAPVYILFGEEGYFIDELVKGFESMVPEGEQDFNLYSFFAHEITPEIVVSTCMRFPMMSDRQVVILREAQSVHEHALNKLADYIAHPNQVTTLVICFRGEKAKGADMLASARKNGAIFFESKKLNERTIDPVISQLVKDKGLNIEAKGLSMLRDFIGTDVAKMYCEIDKLALILGRGSMITPESIERHVAVSKDFNNFELIAAIAERNLPKMMRIAYYFRSNPKAHPLTLTIALIYNYFASLITAQFTRDKSPGSLMEALGLKWQSQINQYNIGMRHYNAYQTLEILSAIRRFDVNSKGGGSRMDINDLFIDLMYRIANATGKIEL